MKGLELYPPCGFYPNERLVTTLWEKANEMEIPVMVHSGPTFPQLKMKYSQTIYLEDVLVRYPSLNTIIAHCGGVTWAEEVVGLRQLRDNMYADISGWQGMIYARNMRREGLSTSIAVYDQDAFLEAIGPPSTFK